MLVSDEYMLMSGILGMHITGGKLFVCGCVGM